MSGAKSFLERVQFTIGRRQALNGAYVVTIGLHGQHDARACGLTVEQDRARTAHPVLAPDVRAGETEILANEVAEEQARLRAEAEEAKRVAEEASTTVWPPNGSR